VEAPVPGGLPARRSPAHGRGAGPRGVAVGRRGRRGVRRGGGLLVRHAGPAAADRRAHDPARELAPVPDRRTGAAAGSRTDRRRRQSRPVAHRRAADRSRDRGGAPRRIGLPRPRAAAARPVPTGVPRLLPQHRPARVDRGRAAPGGRGGPGRLRRRATAGASAAGCRHRWLGARTFVRALAHRPGVPAAEGRGRGGRMGLARRCRALPYRPPQAERARAGGLGPAALHLARPRRAAGSGARRDPGDRAAINAPARPKAHKCPNAPRRGGPGSVGDRVLDRRRTVPGDLVDQERRAVTRWFGLGTGAGGCTGAW
jgi:hypothetical protein